MKERKWRGRRPHIHAPNHDVFRVWEKKRRKKGKKKEKKEEKKRQKSGEKKFQRAEVERKVAPHTCSKWGKNRDGFRVLVKKEEKRKREEKKRKKKKRKKKKRRKEGEKVSKSRWPIYA